MNPVEFDKTDASGVVLAADDRRPVSLDKRGEDGGFTVVARRQAARLNCRLLRLFPIIVSEEQVPVAIV